MLAPIDTLRKTNTSTAGATVNAYAHASLASHHVHEMAMTEEPVTTNSPGDPNGGAVLCADASVVSVVTDSPTNSAAQAKPVQYRRAIRRILPLARNPPRGYYPLPTMQVRSDVPLAPLTTLRLGGVAARMHDIEREEEVVDAVRDASTNREPLFVLGGGSNIVVADEGFPGLVVRIATRGIVVRRQDGQVLLDVAAGEDWDELVARSVAEGWCGLECMSGIPGLVGATPIQNVGAYGQEVSETIAAVRAYDRAARGFVDLDARDCHFAYRTSVFRRNDRWIVTSVRFFLTHGRTSRARYGELAHALGVPLGAPAPAALVRETVIRLRRAKGMLLSADDPDSVSAGSFFVNPMVDNAGLADITVRAGASPPNYDAGDGRRKVAAGWLVERAGFVKGWGEGRVGVSRKHALALVNRGGATSRELLSLARTIRDGVRERFGVTLELEPVLVGCSWEEHGL